jgi:putative PIN family toxin of toxin-antitoxin system
VTRICLDSNVLIAAFASRGLCDDLVRLVITEHEVVLPAQVVQEVRRVLGAKLRLSPEAMAAVEAVFERCEIVPPGSGPPPVKLRDPDDERILADAAAGGCELVITGDLDLLSAATSSPIPILSPREFMTLARGGTL